MGHDQVIQVVFELLLYWTPWWGIYTKASRLTSWDRAQERPAAATPNSCSSQEAPSTTAAPTAVRGGQGWTEYDGAI